MGAPGPTTADQIVPSKAHTSQPFTAFSVPMYSWEPYTAMEEILMLLTFPRPPAASWVQFSAMATPENRSSDIKKLNIKTMVNKKRFFLFFMGPPPPRIREPSLTMLVFLPPGYNPFNYDYAQTKTIQNLIKGAGAEAPALLFSRSIPCSGIEAD
jgi:hypothetical protein